jgi:hypothetical protein
MDIKSGGRRRCYHSKMQNKIELDAVMHLPTAATVLL